MKKILRTMLCLTLALAMSISVSAVAFAAEGAEGDVSLTDILDLLSSLSTEEIEEEVQDDAPVEEIAQGTTSTVGDVTFVLPETMQSMGENDEGATIFMSVPNMDNVVVMSEIDNPEGIDIREEANQEAFKEMLAGEGSEVNNFALVTVQGKPALWIDSTTSIGNSSANTGSIVVDLGGKIYVASMTVYNAEYMDEFTAFVNSIQIAGAEGETDLSAVQGGAPAPEAVDAPEAAPAEAPANAIDATAVEEVVLLDDELCTVTIKKFEIPEDDYYGFSAKVFVENKTSDINIWAHMENVSVNGYMIDPYWGEDVAAGHKSNSEMSIRKEDLAANGITDISELSFRMEIDDDDNYDDLEMADFTVLPFGTNVPAQPEPTFDDTDIVLVDNEDFCMIITGEPVWSDYYLSLPVYIENRTNRNIQLDAYGSSALNGYEISPSLYGTIAAGKRINTEISWSVDELTENDIEAIEDVELDLTVSDADDWSADSIFEDMIYFAFE